MLRPAPDATCSPLDPRQCCAPRWDAVREGTFYYSVKHEGWMKSGGRQAWMVCPWCGGDLPGVELVLSRFPVLRRRRHG